MSIIEGIGDEVTIFVTFFFILTGLLLAWLTTTLNPGAPSTDVNVTSEVANEEADQSGTPGNATHEPEPPDTTGGDVRNRLYPELNRRNSAGGEPDPTAETVDTTEPVPPAEPTEHAERLDGHIRLKIKYLDERERYVQVRPEENIESFKRTHFAGELAENLLVRLIYNGQELRGDSTTLSSYNIGDLSVVHCLITRSRRPQEHNGQAEPDSMEIDLSNLMFPLFGLILGLIWYCRIAYRNFFNAMSTLALIGITVLFFFACVITFRNNRLHETFPPPPQPVHHQHQE